MCLGCKRTIEEIQHWSVMHPYQKLEVLKQIQQRGYDVIKDESQR